jgi:hypothetical protein
MIENSSKVKVRKIYLPRRESKRQLSNWQPQAVGLETGCPSRGGGEALFIPLVKFHGSFSPQGSSPWAVSPGQLFLGWGLLLLVILRSSSPQNSGDLCFRATILALLSKECSLTRSQTEAIVVRVPGPVINHQVLQWLWWQRCYRKRSSSGRFLVQRQSVN